MASLDDLAERVERLVLRHQELKRTTALMAQQLVTVTAERDSLRSRLAAARARVDALIERLPVGTEAQPAADGDRDAEAADADAGRDADALHGGERPPAAAAAVPAAHTRPEEAA